ncbi:enoyl-CoA hydratase-related protein [Okibacterium endophyticum]
MTDSILCEVSDGLARVTLNRPDSLNAIDESAARAWCEIATEIAESDEVQVVLLDALGPAFCAGGDVMAFAQMAGGSGADPSTGSGGARLIAELADVIHNGHRILRETPKPIVAAVQGAVAGGGLGFMLVADYIVASGHARFVSKYADIGLTPDCGVSTLLPEAVGMRRALELMLSDRSLTAAEALEWGLITEVVPAHELSARAYVVADHWLAGATDAFGQAKRLLRASPFRDYRDSLDDEARTIAASLASPAAHERIAAFAARSAGR